LQVNVPTVEGFVKRITTARIFEATEPSLLQIVFFIPRRWVHDDIQECFQLVFPISHSLSLASIIASSNVPHCEYDIITALRSRGNGAGVVEAVEDRRKAQTWFHQTNQADPILDL
jgi:hypothetical protein